MMLRRDWLVFNSCDWCVLILTVPVGCSLSGPFSCSSPVVVFFDRGHPCFWNFNPIIPVDVVRVKFYMSIASLTLRVYHYVDHDQYTLPRPKADGVRCCECAVKRRRSGYGLPGCLSRAPLSQQLIQDAFFSL